MLNNHGYYLKINKSSLQSLESTVFIVYLNLNGVNSEKLTSVLNAFQVSCVNFIQLKNSFLTPFFYVKLS